MHPRRIPASRVPDEVVDPMVETVMTAPEDQILVVGSEFRVDSNRNGETFDTRPCDACGEMVVDRYLRVVGERRVCIPCQEKLA
jgi:formylmethanofuran dehydrogenase subunit E